MTGHESVFSNDLRKLYLEQSKMKEKGRGGEIQI